MAGVDGPAVLRMFQQIGDPKRGMKFDTACKLLRALDLPFAALDAFDMSGVLPKAEPDPNQTVMDLTTEAECHPS